MGQNGFGWMVRDFIAPQAPRRKPPAWQPDCPKGIWPDVKRDIRDRHSGRGGADAVCPVAGNPRKIYGVEPTEAEWVERHADAIISLFFEASRRA